MKRTTSKRPLPWRRTIKALLLAASEGGNPHAVCAFGQVSSSLAALAMETAGLNVSGFVHVIDTSAVRHIRREHGDEKKERSRGQIAVRDDDFSAIPRMIAAPGWIAFGSRSKMGRDQVAYLVSAPEGWTLIMEELRTGRRQMAIISMRRYPPAMNADRILSTLDPNARSNRGNMLQIVDFEARFNKAAAGFANPIGFPRPRSAPARFHASTESLSGGRRKRNLDQPISNSRRAVNTSGTFAARSS